MSLGFDKALVNREKGRQQLAEVLEQKYSAERRNAVIFRFGSVIFAIGFAAFAFRSAFNSSPDLPQVPARQAGTKEILEQMQKQMNSGDQLMIGSGNELPKDPRARSKGEPKSFEKEKVPLNLSAEVRGGIKRSNPAPTRDQFAGPPSRLEKELEDLKKRKGSRAAKPTYGMYRPATPAEIGKHGSRARRKVTPPASGIYEQLAEVPTHLAADTAAFPQNKK